MNWLICDVIADYHLIRGKGNRTNNPQERIFRSKWSNSSVMWYLYIAHEKGEKFNPVAGVKTYLRSYSRKMTAAGQNEVINLWCNYTFLFIFSMRMSRNSQLSHFHNLFHWIKWFWFVMYRSLLFLISLTSKIIKVTFLYCVHNILLETDASR